MYKNYSYQHYVGLTQLIYRGNVLFYLRSYNYEIKLRKTAIIGIFLGEHTWMPQPNCSWGLYKGVASPFCYTVSKVLDFMPLYHHLAVLLQFINLRPRIETPLQSISMLLAAISECSEPL